MSRATLATVVTLALLLAGTAAPQAVASSPATVRAIVVLKDQVDPAAVRQPGKRKRRIALERALRATAAESQRGLLALLRQRRAQGLVDRVEPLWILNGVAVSAAPSVIAELAGRADVREIVPDHKIQAPAPAAGPATVPEPGVARINAPALWDLGLRGAGVVIANVDTGVDATHPDLSGRWRGGANSWYDPNGEHQATPTDVNGHGTATMGVMVGGDAGGTAIGVAPDATWIAVKIFNDRGTATSTGIHKGLQWLLDPDGNPATADAPDVVNNSWTMSGGGCDLGFQLDLRQLRAAGILPVFAAGNYGPTPGTVFGPANLPEAFAVGALDDADVIDPSSGRGPSACGGAIVPRVTAPGVDVHTTDLYGLYADLSGTSLAAPHAAGALALLLGAFPDLPADRQAAALEAGAADLGVSGPDNDYGYGRLDALAAYEWLGTTPDFGVAVSPGSASVAPSGTASYTVSVTGVNGFGGDVSLGLDGLGAAQASWTFSPQVIAGGSGTAELTVTTSAGIAPRVYPLTVTATDGSVTRRSYASLVVPDFTLGATPSSSIITRGTSTTFAVSTRAVNGFTGDVALSVTGLPAGASATFSPNPVGVPRTSTLTVRTTTAAARGTFPLRVTGAGSGLSHQATVTLTIR